MHTCKCDIFTGRRKSAEERKTITVSREVMDAGLSFEADEEACTITAFCTAVTDGKTGVEMEALTGVSVALLTIYDMCKAIDKRMQIGDIHLVEKTGGKSGHFCYDE